MADAAESSRCAALGRCKALLREDLFAEVAHCGSAGASTAASSRSLPVPSSTKEWSSLGASRPRTSPSAPGRSEACMDGLVCLEAAGITIRGSAQPASSGEALGASVDCPAGLEAGGPIIDRERGPAIRRPATAAVYGEELRAPHDLVEALRRRRRQRSLAPEATQATVHVPAPPSAPPSGPTRRRARPKTADAALSTESATSGDTVQRESNTDSDAAALPSADARAVKGASVAFMDPRIERAHFLRAVQLLRERTATSGLPHGRPASAGPLLGEDRWRLQL